MRNVAAMWALENDRRLAMTPAHSQSWKLDSVSVCRANFAEFEPTVTFSFRVAEEEGLILQLVNDGCLLVEQGGQIVRLTTGTLLVRDAVKHKLPVVLEAADVTVMHIPKRHLVERGWTLNAARGPLIPDFTSADMRAVTELIRCAAHHSNSIGIDLRQRIERQLLDLLEVILNAHAYLNGRRGAEAIVFRAKTFIERHYKDIDLDAQRVAEAVSVSPKHLQRLFNSQGLTVMRYLWKIRLDHATTLLRRGHDSALTIQAIAWQCGFSSAAHFSRAFKRTYGVSPAVMRHERAC